ncbi:MAG: ribonuclease HI family protein [Nanoarchaeota archaeon]
MIITNSDGGARGNPGPGAIGVIIRREGEILKKFSKFIGERVTNNIAEYEALIMALKLALEYDKEVTCVLDSELLVKQLLGEYRVKQPQLLDLFKKVQKEQDKFDKVKYVHVSRWDKFQQMADELVNEELDNKGYKRKYR